MFSTRASRNWRNGFEANRLSLFLGRRVVLNPEQILVFRRRLVVLVPFVRGLRKKSFLESSRIEPALCFHMSIGKGIDSAMIMVARRITAKDLLAHEDPETRTANTVGMNVGEQ